MKNAREMKAGNRLRVLRLLRRGPLSRSELAPAVGLTRAAISLIVGELLADGLVVETGLRDSAAGRHPVLVELQPEYAYSMGLTLSRTGAEAGVADFAGQLLCRTPIDIAGATRAKALSRIRETLKKLARQHSAPGRHWLGLGISTPGPVDVAAGLMLNPPNFDLWHNTPLCSQFQEIGFPHCFLENNAQALTMAEKAFGVGKICKSFLLLVVETGIGGGIVRNEELYAGWRGFGNEIGHTSIDYQGSRCDCGLRGCMETFASVRRVLAQARKQHPRLKDWPAFMDLAAGGDRACVRLARQQAAALGTAVVNVLNVLELDAVVLTGDVLYRGELLRAQVERFVAENAMNRRLRHIPVYLSPLGERPELRAAAAISAEKFFEGHSEAGELRPRG